MRQFGTCAHHGVLFLDELGLSADPVVAVDDALDVAEVAAAITRARQELPAWVADSARLPGCLKRRQMS
jgi:hypothetical protein